MSEFKRYQRRGTIIEARPYVPGEPINRADLAISIEDLSRPSLAGGMICRNPDNSEDRWYINPDYFAKHYDEEWPATPIRKPWPHANALFNEDNMNEQKLEAELQALSVAPRVTLADVDNAIASEHYFTALDGATAAQMLGFPDADKLGLLTFCVLVLKNGFTVSGESACASPENFNAEKGREIARSKAKEKIWPLLGYNLKEHLYQTTQPQAPPAPSTVQERLHAEKLELDARLTKLLTFVGSTAFGKLREIDQTRLKRQEDLMRSLTTVLAERLIDFQPIGDGPAGVIG